MNKKKIKKTKQDVLLKYAKNTQNHHSNVNQYWIIMVDDDADNNGNNKNYFRLM